MKVITFFCALSLITISISAQSLNFGFGFLYYSPNTETNTGGGATILAETIIYDNLSLRGSGTFILSEFSTDNQELKTYQYFQTQFELIGIYKPINWNIEPYFGIGFGFYNPENQQSGNSNDVNGYPVGIKDIKSGIGTNIFFGLDLSPQSKVNFLLEFKRTFFRSNYVYLINKEEFEKNIDLSSNTFSIMIRFKIF